MEDEQSLEQPLPGPWEQGPFDGRRGWAILDLKSHRTRLHGYCERREMAGAGFLVVTTYDAEGVQQAQEWRLQPGAREHVLASGRAS